MKIAAKVLKCTFAGAAAGLVFIGSAMADSQIQVAGFETYAVVEPVMNETAAQPFAQRHCAKYGRFESFRWMEGHKALFDCQVRKTVPQPQGRGTGGLY